LSIEFGTSIGPGFEALVFKAARGREVEEERKKLDQRLRDQQFYTRSLIESNIDALMTMDPRGIITDVNKQAEALTGCTRDELIGAPFKNYFTDAARAEAVAQPRAGAQTVHTLGRKIAKLLRCSTGKCPFDRGREILSEPSRDNRNRTTGRSVGGTRRLRCGLCSRPSPCEESSRSRGRTHPA
jgi:hypothetical protein